jgi:hypothetical protein
MLYRLVIHRAEVWLYRDFVNGFGKLLTFGRAR